MNGLNRLTRFEQWRDRLPARQNALEIQREIEAIANRMRAEQAARPCNLTPFPDPVGDDRDERPVIEWDLTRG